MIVSTRPVAGAERPVPLILGVLTSDGSLAPLAAGGRDVHELAGMFELSSLNHYLKDALDASAR